MKSGVHSLIRPYVQISFILSTLLFVSSVSNTAFSEKVNYTSNLLQQMPSNLTTSSNSALKTSALLVKLLSNNLENHIRKAGAILEITSKLLQVRNVSYAQLLNQTLMTLHGIPQNADIEKREVAKNIISVNSGLYEMSFIMPNGDVYFIEPYSIQQIHTGNNYAFRDYFQGAIKTNDTYLGDVIVTAAASGNREAVIAVPVYSLKDNSTFAGVWAGGIDFKVFDKELQSLKLPSDERVVYVGHNGQKIADSDINKSKNPESFASLNSFKSAINGQSGSAIDTVDNTKMLVTYRPINAFHNTWAVLLMQRIR